MPNPPFPLPTIPPMPNPNPTNPQPMTTAVLSVLDRDAFTAALDGVFEHSPWVARAAYDARPFTSVQQLHDALVASMYAASYSDRLALIRAHPRLTGRIAEPTELTPDSAVEQASAGLDRCTADEVAELRSLNRRYSQRFGFPFIIAVKNKTRDQILAAFRRRVADNQAQEFTACLDQIAAIARIRLGNRLRPTGGGEQSIDPQPSGDGD